MCSIPGLPAPGSEVHVLIARVNLNPSCGLVEMWVDMNDERQHIYKQMKEEIKIPKRKFHGSEGKPGDLCLACIIDTWHRARIISIQDNTYSVFLIDQGQPHTATSEMLAWAHSDSFLLPPEFESCILANVILPENNLPERATKFLKSLPGNKFSGMVQHVLMPEDARKIILDIPTISKHICDLGVPNIPREDIKSLVLKCVTSRKGEASEACSTTQEENLKVSSQSEKDDQYLYPELTIDTFQIVTVTEVTDPHTLFCKLKIFSKALKILSEQIQQHYQESSEFGEAQPRTSGDPCAAKDDKGRWHRSLLKQSIMTDSGAVEVLHVDEGKTDLVPVRDIRPLHGKFLRMPVVTYPCSLKGLNGNGTEWTPDQVDYLKSLLFHKTLMATFELNISQDVYHVTLYAANASCINSYFLEKVGLFPPSEDEDETHFQTEAINAPFLGLHGGEQDLQNKANADSLQDDTLPPNQHVEVNSSSVGVSKSSTKDRLWLEHPDSLPQDSENDCEDNIFTVGSRIDVKVSCIESLQKFWCQPTEKSDSLQRLMEDLQNHHGNTPHPSLVESMCVARNPDTDKWCRARIIASPHPPVVDIKFIDYGQTRKVPLQDVRPIDPVFLKLGAQAFQCSFFNLENPSNSTAACTDAALAEFQKCVDSHDNSCSGLKCVVKAVMSDEGLQLYMVDIETPTPGACKLLGQTCAETEADAQTPPQVRLDTYSHSTHNIEVGGKEEVCVTSSESVGHFFCQLVRNSHLLDKVTKDIQRLIGQPQCTDRPLGLNSICFARRADSQWHRGQIVEMSPKLKVHFVDFGDTLAVDKSDICPLPADGGFARSVPVLAVPLGLFDVLAEVPQEVNEWFANSATGRSLTILVVAKGDKGKLLVELFDGAQNVNVQVLERILKMAQEKKSGFVQQTDQLSSKSSEPSPVPKSAPMDVSGLTEITEENHDHSGSETCPGEEVAMKSQSLSNVFAEYEKTLDVAVVENDFVLAETGIEQSHGNSEITQLPVSPCLEGCVNVCVYNKPNIFQKQGEEVYASCVVGPHFFWCQYANSEDLNKLSTLAQEAGQAQQDSAFLKTLSPGSPCLALFPSDSQWYRAQVLHRTDSSLHVVFVDYGNESDIDINNVKPLPQVLLDMAPQAFLCSLDGFDESKGSWDDQVYDDFYNLLVDKPLTVTVLKMEGHPEIGFPQYSVQIESQNVVLNDRMQKYWKPVAMEHGMTESPQKKVCLHVTETESSETQLHDSKGKPNTCKYNKPKLSQNQKESVFASCIVDPSFFWCQYSNSEDLNKLSTLAQEAGQAQQDSAFLKTLGPGSPCLALFPSDSQWYRAQVLHRTDSSLHVVFVDYGNESDIDINNVKPLPQVLLDMAPQAFLCSLDGFDESKGSWDDQVYDDFYNLLVDKPLTVTVLKMGDHSEIDLPRYSVQIESQNMVLNDTMQKYWKPVAMEHGMTESPQNKICLQLNETSKEKQLHDSNGRPNTCTYKQQKLSKNQKESVFASCIVDPGFFWCQYSNSEDLNKLSTLAQEAGQAQQDSAFLKTLGPGSPCLAPFPSDSQWYRAQVIKKTGNRLHILFVDYGNETDIDIKNVKPLPQVLLETVPQAFLCSLNGFDESKGSWDDQVYDDFYNLLANKPLTVTVLNMEGHSDSEIDLIQYSVELGYEGVVINAMMEKYWNGLHPAAAPAVGFKSEHPDETKIRDEVVGV